MSTAFTLNGGVEQKDFKWNAVVSCHTPDGKITKLESGYIYFTQKEAEFAMEQKLNDCLDVFKKDGVEVLARNGITQQ
jgi:hypothetical protein